MLKFQNHIGLDIGSKMVKLVQVTPVDKKYRLVTFGQIEVPQTNNAAEAEMAKAEVIKKLVKDCQVTSRQVVISLPESQVYTRVIEMPDLEEPELSQAIRWQAEQYIPVPLSDVVLKHQVLTPIQDNESAIEKKISLLLIAAPNMLLTNYVNLMAKAGLEAIAIETEILAVGRAMVGQDPFSPTTLLVHMGAETTTLSVLTRGDLALTQSLSTGGTAIARAVASALGLELNQAEEYKRSYGLDETKLEGKVVNAIKPIVELIVAELKRVLAFYNVHGSKEPVKRVVLTGGTALLPGLVPYLTATLGLEVQAGNPFASIELTEKQRKEIGESSTLYATAVGLALKPT